MEMFCLSWLFEQDLLKYTKKNLLDIMLTGCRCLSAHSLTFIFFKWFTPTLCCTDFFFFIAKKDKIISAKLNTKSEVWPVRLWCMVQYLNFFVTAVHVKGKTFFFFCNWWTKSLEKMGMLPVFSPNWFPVFICFVKLATEHRFPFLFSDTHKDTHTHTHAVVHIVALSCT